MEGRVLKGAVNTKVYQGRSLMEYETSPNHGSRCDARRYGLERIVVRNAATPFGGLHSSTGRSGIHM